MNESASCEEKKVTGMDRVQPDLHQIRVCCVSAPVRQLIVSIVVNACVHTGCA